MKQIPNKERKFFYLSSKYGWQCPIAKSKGAYAEITFGELHHSGIHNTIVNQKKYPLLVHSLWNLVPVNHDYHISNGSWGKISYREADKRERFLERHPKIADWMNGKTRGIE